MGTGSGNSAKFVFRQTRLSPAPWAYALFSQDLEMSGNTEGEPEGESWHCCKNSLELIRQSMHIFANIFSRGGRKVHNLDLQRGMFSLHSTLATYMELYSPLLSKHR